MLSRLFIHHCRYSRPVQLFTLTLIVLVTLPGCRPAPVTTLPPALKPSLAWPECPKIGGMYELQGEALPGSMNFYRNRDNKLTLNAMLGVAAPADLTQESVRVELVHDDTLELVNRYDGAITAHQLDLQPEDRVTCEHNRIRIHRTRAEGGVAEEPLRNISEFAQELTVEGDGSLLVKTRILNQSKSAFWSTPIPPEEYAARFRRLD
ncbi:MAG: hypothetical protein LZF62_440005 [Nitrospira sp.]|nr:MAG: hypothetical protein LZF62_440005 [Nitrospira sp.]